MEQNEEKSEKQAESGVIEYIHEGQLCPNCRFAHLVKEPGNIIRCPICGYGNGAGCT
jgi:rubrerythrin